MTETLVNFTLMAKPSGPRCNLRCEYCFYLRKAQYFKGQRHRMHMSDPVLEAYVRKYLEAVSAPEVVFAWQGGEPTLMGLPFFRKALQLQRHFGKGRRITNTMQTNGILLDDEWCRFLGNILHDDLKALVLSDRQRDFGARKEHGLSSACRQCALRFACHGGCPKHRFGGVTAGDQG